MVLIFVPSISHPYISIGSSVRIQWSARWGTQSENIHFILNIMHIIGQNRSSWEQLTSGKVPLIVDNHSKCSILPVPLIAAGLTQFSRKLH